MAAAVTVACAILAFPIAYTMARLVSPRTRHLLVVAILIPLWASYLVKVYSWRIILAENGVLNWLLEPFGLSGPGYTITGTWLVFTYLWLPYMILPIYAGLERIPASLLEASSDLGGRNGTTFVRVVLPLLFPALVAGSIFTFSLTLGDYITPQVVGNTQFIGNVIYRNIGGREQPAVRGGVRVRADHRHGRLPARSPAARERSRTCSRGRGTAHPVAAAGGDRARARSSSTSRS